MQLIDAHCHFDDARLDHDRDRAYRRARDAGVVMQIIPGIKAAWWPRIKQTCERYAGLFANYGLHPMFIPEHEAADLDALAQWLEREKPVAIGECGLDFYIDDPQPDLQQFYFEAQLALAQQFHLPVVIHARRSVEQVINTLCRFPGIRGMLHSFSGSEQQARRLIDLGFYLSFGGPATYTRANRLHQLLRVLPLEVILLETDAPDQPGSQHRGQRNEPAYLPEVLQTLSELREEPIARIAEQTNANTRLLFSI